MNLIALLLALAGAETALMQGRDPDQVFEELTTTLEAQGTDLIASKVADGVALEATETGAAGTIWIAERDACLDCAALSGETSTARPAFDGSITWGDRVNSWQGFNGRPPRHPHCRCRIEPWLGDTGMPESLKREAERSVLRGWSLPSESTPARLRAAQRILSRGTVVPKSVERYARDSLREGKFPLGRTPP